MDSNFRGPLANMGAMEDSPSNVQLTDGPSYSYQGMAIADVRQAPYPKDGVGPGRAAAFLDNPRMVVIDQIPQATSTVSLAVAAAVATSVAMTLVTTAINGTAGVPSNAPLVPIVPFGGSSVTNAAIALDFGFATGTTAAGSGVVVVNNTSIFTPGQWLVIGGVGNAAKTTSLVTQVQSVGSTATITVSPVALGTLNNAPIDSANLFNSLTPPATQFGPAAVSANAWSPSLAAGVLRVHNPMSLLSRCISITGVATTAAGGTFTIAGWDWQRQPMTETITKAAGTTTAYGQKAFKFIASVTPNFGDAATYSIGLGDTVGFPLRADRWEHTEIMYGGIRVVTDVGFLAAVLTAATATSGDVRGTVQLSSAGAATALASPAAAATNGVKRLTIIQTLPVWNTINATPLNTVPMFGVTQA